MKKTKVFNVSRVIASYNGRVYNRPIYHSMSSRTSPIVFIEFSIHPTTNTKKLFKILLDNYNDSDHCSRISKKDMGNFKDCFIDEKEFDIIRGMSYTMYEAKLYNGNYEENSVTYPVLIKTLNIGMETIIQFDKNFKRFFDESFEI